MFQQRSKIVGCLGILIWLGAAAPAGAIAIAVPDFRAERGLDEALGRLLNELLLAEFASIDGVSVVGGSDLKAMLELEQQKEMFGCGDESCLVEIGAALGVDLLCVPTVGRIGSKFLLNLKLLNVRRSSVEARWSRALAGNEDALMEGVSQGVRGLIGAYRGVPVPVSDRVSVAEVKQDSAPRASTTQASSETMVRLEESGSVPGWSYWVVGGVGALGVTLGVLSGLTARNEATKRDNAVGEQEYNDAHKSARAAALRANLGFGVALAAVGTGLGLWWWDSRTPATDPDSTEVRVALSPTDGGAFVSLNLFGR